MESEEREEREEREENTGMAIDVGRRVRLDVSPGIKGRSECDGESWRDDDVRGSWGR